MTRNEQLEGEVGEQPLRNLLCSALDYANQKDVLANFGKKFAESNLGKKSMFYADLGVTFIDRQVPTLTSYVKPALQPAMEYSKPAVEKLISCTKPAVDYSISCAKPAVEYSKPTVNKILRYAHLYASKGDQKSAEDSGELAEPSVEHAFTYIVEGEKVLPQEPKAEKPSWRSLNPRFIKSAVGHSMRFTASLICSTYSFLEQSSPLFKKVCVFSEPLTTRATGGWGAVQNWVDGKSGVAPKELAAIVEDSEPISTPRTSPTVSASPVAKDVGDKADTAPGELNNFTENKELWPAEE